MKKILSYIVLIFPLTVSASISDLNLVYSIGLTAGGETLAERSDGVELESGGMYYLAMGVVLKISSDFQLQGNIGYHFDDLEASNGSADFSRTFAELIPYYMLSQKIRIGVGMVNTFEPEYSDPGGEVGFENALGMISEVNWQHSRGSWWGVRYVNMDYTVSNVDGFSVSNGAAIDGSYLGLMFHSIF